MRTNKNTSKIFLAVIVAALATMISYSAFSGMQNELSEQKKLIEFMQSNKPDSTPEYAYAVSTINLKAGEIVAESDVDFKNFELKNDSAFENRSDVVNKVLLQDIASGDVFTSAHIAKISSDDLTLKEGYRALTLPADSFQGKSNSMKIGSCVDIYSASSESPWALENVRIISFEPMSVSSSSKTGAPVSMDNAAAITFEVAAGSISDFISNVSKSKMVLVTRAPGDKKMVVKKQKPSFSYSQSYSPSYSAGSYKSLPSLPSSPPVTDFSGLPEPVQPVIPQKSVEIIEANVKSKVTFD